MPKVGLTDTILRDGHQSQAATRMTTAQMEPMFAQLDKIGYYSLECWGGATFDSCLRFLNEDPWERLRILRKGLPNTKLQMLLRGQNLLGYKHYADDVVEFFVKKSIENGIDIIRCFDALNDIRNMETAVKATKKYGGTAEVAMSYTVSRDHRAGRVYALYSGQRSGPVRRHLRRGSVLRYGHHPLHVHADGPGRAGQHGQRTAVPARLASAAG